MPAAVVALLGILMWVLGFLDHGAKLWHSWIELRSRPEKDPRKRERQLLSQSFATLARHSSERDWRDEYFTELEAEVEVEVARTPKRWRPFAPPSDIRLEASLTSALLHCKDKLIYLEGDPGSGKSVSLRHIVRTWRLNAEANDPSGPVPLYLDLQRLRTNGGPIDRPLIESFVHRELRRLNHSDIEDFIERDFRPWCREGRLLFLFDSFDEIKDILGSTENDSIVDKYAAAIQDFAYTQNNCRVVVASRRFRGPKRAGWTHFLIRPLSEGRATEFVQRHVRDPALLNEIVGHLQLSTPEFRELAGNPLMLTLLCKHVNELRFFPRNAHEILSKFVQRRFQRDEYRINEKFGMTTDDLRLAAESIAMEISSDPTLGLRPTRRALSERVVRGSDPDASIFSALEMTRLVAIEPSAEDPGDDTIQFTHRRFQEFFASSYILQHPTIIEPRLLLTDYRWREACVTMFQHSSQEALETLMTDASELVLELKRSALPTAEEPDFSWPPKAIHVLDVLQSGFAYRIDVPNSLAEDIAWLVEQALIHGNILDQKWALEVAGTIPEDKLAGCIDFALVSGSRILRDAAFLQIHRISRATAELRKSLLKMLQEMATNGKLAEEKLGIELKLSKLPDSPNLISAARAFRALPWMDIAFQFVVLSATTCTLGINRIHSESYVPHTAFAIATFASLIMWTFRGRAKLIGNLFFRMLALFSFLLLLDSSKIADHKKIPDSVAIPLLILVVYFWVWPSMAFAAYSRGFLVKPWQRAFSPFSLLMWWHWSRHGKILALIFVIQFALMLPFIIILEGSQVFDTLMITTVTAGSLYLGFLIVRNIAHRTRDASTFRSTIEEAATYKDLLAILIWLGRFRTARFRAHGLRALRKRGVFQGDLARLSRASAKNILLCLALDRQISRKKRSEIRRDISSQNEPSLDDEDWVLYWYYSQIGIDEVVNNSDLVDEFALAFEPFLRDAESASLPWRLASFGQPHTATASERATGISRNP